MNCHEILSTFPEELGCLDVAEYAGRIPCKTQYLGGNRVLVERMTIVSIWKTYTPQVRELLFDWWKDNLLYGDGYFHITIKFFGLMRNLIVRFTKDLSEIMKDVANETPIVLEIMNPYEVRADIEYVHEFDCDESIECSTHLICI